MKDLRRACFCTCTGYPFGPQVRVGVWVAANRHPGRRPGVSKPHIPKFGESVKELGNGHVQWVDELYYVCIGLFLFNRPVKLGKARQIVYPLFFSGGASTKLCQISTHFVSLQAESVCF